MGVAPIRVHTGLRFIDDKEMIVMPENGDMKFIVRRPRLVGQVGG